MNITILCVGKLKEKYWRDAEAEYSKRLKRFVNLQITELKESLLPANASPADEAAVKEAEGEAILAKIKSLTEKGFLPHSFLQRSMSWGFRGKAASSSS